MSKTKGEHEEKPVKEASDKSAVEAAIKEVRARPVRVTRDMLVNKGPLRIPTGVIKPGMVGYWMKEAPYAYDKYYERGYDYAHDKDGQVVRSGSKGEVMILLEVPQEIYDQTQALKQEIRAETTAERKDLDPEKSRAKVRGEGIFEEELSIKKV